MKRTIDLTSVVLPTISLLCRFSNIIYFPPYLHWPFLVDLGCRKSQCPLHYPQHIYSGDFWIKWERIKEVGGAGGEGVGLHWALQPLWGGGMRGLVMGVLSFLPPRSKGSGHLWAPGANPTLFPLGDRIRVPHLGYGPSRFLCQWYMYHMWLLSLPFLLSPDGFRMLLSRVLQAVKISFTSVPGLAMLRSQKQVYVELGSHLSCLCGRVVCNLDVSASFLRVFLQMWSRSFAQWPNLGLVSGTDWFLAKMVIPHYFARDLVQLLHFSHEHIVCPEKKSDLLTKVYQRVRWLTLPAFRNAN